MELVKHETCQQYVARRLSEGWSIVWQRGHYLILSSPDGNILRPVDLRNDVETLRPNAVGDETSIGDSTPAAEPHYTLVDDIIPDEGTTRVNSATVAPQVFQRDLYNIPNSSGSGTINKITVYFRVYVMSLTESSTKASIKSDSTVTDGDEKVPSAIDTWETLSQEWATNPADGEVWERADIDGLQIGVSLKGLSAKVSYWAYCTQVYVEVDWRPEAVGRSQGFIIG